MVNTKKIDPYTSESKLNGKILIVDRVNILHDFLALSVKQLTDIVKESKVVISKVHKQYNGNLQLNIIGIVR